MTITQCGVAHDTALGLSITKGPSRGNMIFFINILFISWCKAENNLSRLCMLMCLCNQSNSYWCTLFFLATPLPQNSLLALAHNREQHFLRRKGMDGKQDHLLFYLSEERCLEEICHSLLWSVGHIHNLLVCHGLLLFLFFLFFHCWKGPSLLIGCILLCS